MDGAYRDAVSQDLGGVLCFEMEAVVVVVVVVVVREKIVGGRAS